LGAASGGDRLAAQQRCATILGEEGRDYVEATREQAILSNTRWARTAFALCCALVAFGIVATPAFAGGPALKRLGSAPTGQQLQLVLPLRANITGLEAFATAVTSIGSPLYGDFQPVATLARRFGASAGDRARVVRYLRREGARDVRIDVTGLFADATMSASRARHVFGTSLARYRAARAARATTPVNGAHVPAALGGAVTGVVGLDARPLFGAPASKVSDASRFPRTPLQPASRHFVSGYGERTGTASGCPSAISDHGFTPNQYLTAYDYSSLQASGVTGQDERVALIEIDGFRYSDLRTFASCFHFPVPAVNAYGVGLKHPLAPGGETTLDLELLDAAAPGLKEIDVYESPPRAAQVLEALTAPLHNRGHVPEVISASLGTCEPALKITIGRSGVRAAEGALALAAASGISVLASSGDAGSSACIGNDGPLDRLAVSYPASSPYVTAVGGTNVALTASNQIEAQTVWNDAPLNISAGGGGLSSMFKRPAYQNGFDSHRNRALPDVSLLGDVLPGYDIYCTAKECLQGSPGPWITVGGTSAAAPLFAGGLALVDEVLREHHKQNVGLANSLLYDVARHFGSAGVLSDVTSNDNDLGPYLVNGNRRPLGCCSAGPGYDLASGLGSVDLGKLALLAIGLQPAIADVTLSLPPQRPVARHRMLARLECTERCIAAAVATVSIPGARPFTVRSTNAVLRRRGSKTLALRFSRQQVRMLRRGVHAHEAITASVVGQVIDSGGNLEASTSAQTLQITS
jgi:Pro-kumamolisin, activation domain/Subtilase family